MISKILGGVSLAVSWFINPYIFTGTCITLCAVCHKDIKTLYNNSNYKSL